MAASDWSAEYHGYKTVKRLLDMSIALIVLVVFSPLWLLIAVLVRLTSPGPALYRLQREVGLEGREFTMYKFRTMYHNSDDDIHRRVVSQIMRGQPVSYEVKGDAQVPVYKLVNDPRVTPFGRLLRRFGLDEIPQFINVLRGELSVVGPRPALYYEYEMYGEYHRKRLSVLPGITGLYQVTARSAVPFEQMVEIDMQYIAQRSIWLDIWIILKTPWVMLAGKGAH
jgi:lipopolysaccharide/colanic/teichoic acid biosynthesis glycosyltransferase